MNSPLESMIHQAIQAFQSGNLKGAEIILNRVLAAHPKNLPALHILGLVKASQSKHKEAAELLKRAIRLNPNDPSLHYNLAKALQESGADKESIPHHKKAVELNSTNPEAWLNYGKSLSNLGLNADALDVFKNSLQINPYYTEGFLNIGATLKDLSRYDEALAAYDKVIHLKPDYHEAWVKKGNILNLLNRYDEALAAYDKAISLKPDYHEAWVNKGNTFSSLNRYDEALAAYDKAISLKPDYHEAWSNRGVVLSELDLNDEALVSYDKAISLKPHYHEAWSNRGVALSELDRNDEALVSYDKAISLKPDYRKAWVNKGNTFSLLNRYDEALAAYDKAISLKPDYHEAWVNKGNTFSSLNRYDEALAAYDKAISLKPDYNEAYWSQALCQLVTGNFESGWKNYEYRWKKNKAIPMRHQQFPLLTNLSEISGKTILVWSEQGYGDTIQFSRFIEKLIKLKADVVFEVQEPLKELLQYSFLGSKVISQAESTGVIDYQIPLVSLPLLFSITSDNIPSRNSYIRVDKDNSIFWEQKLNLKDNKMNIGVACSGNEIHLNDRNRSMDLRFFEPIADKASLFLIQKDLREKDQDFLIQHPGIKYLGKEIKSFNDSASIIQAMDLVITVDTSLAHLSSALGKSTLILLPWSPEWRWLLDRQDSPWYPTAKIFRQPKRGNWDAVIKEVILYLGLKY